MEVKPQNQTYKPFPLWTRAIALTLIVTFLCQDIMWAHPDPLVRNSGNDKLAAKSFFSDPDSIPKAYAMFLDDIITSRALKEANSKKAAISKEDITLQYITYAIEAIAQEDAIWFKNNNISYKKIGDDEITISFYRGSEYILRYFELNPEITNHKRYPSNMKLITQGPVNKKRRIFKQLLKAKNERLRLAEPSARKPMSGQTGSPAKGISAPGERDTPPAVTNGGKREADAAALDAYKRSYNRAPNMNISINPDIEEAGITFACEIIKGIQEWMRKLPERENIVINFCTGDTPWLGYTKMALYLDYWDLREIRMILKAHGVDTSLKPDMNRVTAYPLDAVFPQKRTDYHSFANILNNMFERLHIPEGNRHLFYSDIYEDRSRMPDEDFEELMRDIDKNIDSPIKKRFMNAMKLQAERMGKELEGLGGPHIFLSGVGPSYAGKGHVGFMESGTPFDQKAFIGPAHFHISAGHAKENGGLRNFYVNGEPKYGFVTFGFNELLLRQGNGDMNDDVKVIAISTGNAKNSSVYRGIEGDYDTAYPLSGLQRSRGIFIVDSTSAASLRIKRYPWEFYRIDNWSGQEIKDFFVRLSLACGKRIADLTEDDYLGLSDTGSSDIRGMKKYNLDTLEKSGNWGELKNRVIRKIGDSIVSPGNVAAKLGLQAGTRDDPTEVVIINPHLDDEYLAMADTIEEFVAAGYHVSTYYMAKGYTAVDEEYVANMLNYIRGWTERELAECAALDEEELTAQLAEAIKDNNIHTSPSDYDVWSHMGEREKALRARILFINMNRSMKGALTEKRKLDAVIDFLVASSRFKESWGSKDLMFMSNIKVFIRTTEAKSALMSRGIAFKDIHTPEDTSFYSAEGRGPTASLEDIEIVKNILTEKNKKGRLGLVISNGEGFPDYGAHSTVEISVTRALLELIRERRLDPNGLKYLQYAGVWERIGTDRADLSVVCPRDKLARFEREFRQHYPSQAPPPVPDSGFTGPTHFSKQVVLNARETGKELAGLMDIEGRGSHILTEEEAGVLNYKIFDFTKEEKREELIGRLEERAWELDKVRPIVDGSSNVVLNGPVPLPDVSSMREHIERLKAAGINPGDLISVGDLKKQLMEAKLPKHRMAARRALVVIGTPEALKVLNGLENIIYSLFRGISAQAGRSGPPKPGTHMAKEEPAGADAYEWKDLREEWNLSSDDKGRLRYLLKIFKGEKKLGQINLTIEDRGIILNPCDKGLEVCEIRNKYGTRLLLEGFAHAARIARERGLSPEWALVYYENLPVEIQGDTTYGLCRFLEGLGFFDCRLRRASDEALEGLVEGYPRRAGLRDRFAHWANRLENICKLAELHNIHPPLPKDDDRSGPRKPGTNAKKEVPEKTPQAASAEVALPAEPRTPNPESLITEAAPHTSPPVEGDLQHIAPTINDLAAALDADIQNAINLKTTLEKFYEDDGEKIIYTIRLDAKRISTEYICLIEKYYTQILSSDKVEVKVLGNDKTQGLIDVSIDIGGKQDGSGTVDVNGNKGRIESLGRLVGMVNLAISVATLPEKFPESGVDAYSAILDTVFTQYQLLTGQELEHPVDSKDIFSTIRSMVQNLPPAKTCGTRSQEEFRLMEEKLKSAA